MREYIKTKRIIPRHVAEELEEQIIDYAYEHGMTVANIRDCMSHVEEYMAKNAILEKDQDPEEMPGKGFLDVITKEPKTKEEVRE